MASRNVGRGTSRRSPRISGRSEAPDAFRVATPSRRALSPELVEQMTPPAASLRTRQLLSNLQAAASGSNSNSISIKQEDSSTKYYVREPSYQPSLLRGDQRSFNDTRDANHSHSASLSLFSSEGDLSDNYQQEEQEAAHFQRAQQAQQHIPESRAVVSRRSSGQRKARTSKDNLPYRPQSDDDDDDDDQVASPTRRARRGRNSNSNSLTAYDLGRIDNVRWMNAKSKKGRRKKGVNGVSYDDGEEDDSRENNADDDARAASGKETRFDDASDSADSEQEQEQHHFYVDDDVAQDHFFVAPTPPPHKQRQPAQSDEPREPPVRTRVGRFLRGLGSFLWRLVVFSLTWVLKLPKIAWDKIGSELPHVTTNRAFAVLAGLLFAAAAFQASQLFGRSGGLSDRFPMLLDDDVPGSNSGIGSNVHSLALSLDRENQRLRAELNRLTARLDSLSASIDSQISSSLSSAASKIQAEAESRQSTEINRITASTKRTIARLAQDELKSIQESVSNSVELMLRDLDKKTNMQLKQRADDTEGKFFNKLEKEVASIAKYANDEVNARLGQAFDRTFLSELIDGKLEQYSRDRTGRVDWAAVTSGAWVAEEGTVHRGFRFNSVWNVGQFLAQGRKVPIGDPVKAITPGAGLGADNCWMTGWNSLLQVQLAEPKVIDQLVVEHPLPGMTRTAPRRIVVWAHVDESDRKYYLQYRRSKAKTQQEYLGAILPQPLLDAVPQEYRAEESAPMILAHFEFKANGSTLQTFNLTEEAQVYPFGVHAVRWQFVDGWAKSPPICVHRVRVHGSRWPVLGEKGA
ncbi:hypothetical protein EX895_004293 [Sporisorium graminicola]|uniref:SUN domain-containing protein n=1 Tax=Sporisorium graminicola TaxID=280036 RepID=A0A4U7KQS1_9BASI|nr:hypothetical protein EX895_004293 [Sporisorium graminicola]TKY86653.1 hypothetical protein EX895_004293 [Sporisorium graminicola]